MSKIILCCPFYNESLIAKLQIHEASKWVDEIHITEFDKSFKYTEHELAFGNLALLPKVFYHPMQARGKYLAPRRYIPHFILNPVSRWLKHIVRGTAWYNEAVSRNYSLWNSNYDDDDILILSDVDEIIDSKYSQEIIDAVNQYGIITIRIHFTCFYFNLFCPKFSGPADYSYRIFVVKGKVMREKFHNDSDYLRKCGERSKILDVVKCLDGIKGFHHSWLGDDNFVINKLRSYAHDESDHSSEILTNGKYDIEKIKKKLVNGESIFQNVDLIYNDTIPLLEEVEKCQKDYPLFFLNK